MANLVCASGLPGADPLHIGHYLDWLEEAAQQVRLETERNYYKFLDSPAAFGNSQARFCMVCLVTLLQQQCDVSYSRKWRELTPDCPVPETFGIDACDLTHAWESTGIASEQLLPVLDVIAKQLNLPNHFILPDDSLSILLIPDYDVFQSPGSRLGCARASVWHTALTSLRVWLRTAP